MTPLPYQTPLVGREREVAELTDLLTTSSCRLLTIVGPGGIGKTRLAVEVAAGVVERFPDGLWWVDLQAVRSGADLARTIADAVDLPIHADADPDRHLADFLAPRRALLLLDNFEHLMEQVTLVSDLLRAAPSLQVIVTSREALNLEEEWRYPVPGLPFPAELPDQGQGPDPASSPATRLFADRARRFRPGFRLEEEIPAVTQICRLVEGNPLALELAAAWSATLPCREIAAEIERSVGFLASRTRNTPARHASMQAVFDQSWELLTAEERSAFAALSVLRGGFSRDAALAISGCSLQILSALIDKSLLQSEPGGRFRLHELLQQYAADRLAETPDGSAARERHARHYIEFLHDREGDVTGGEQVRAAREIRRELDNIRAAWEWAVTNRDVAAITRGLRAFDLFCHLESRYREGADLMSRAAICMEDLELDPAGEITRVEVMSNLGWFWIRLGRIEAAAELFRQADQRYQAVDPAALPRTLTIPLGGLATVAQIRGDAHEALRLGELAQRDAEGRGDRDSLAFICYLLAQSSLNLGRDAEAFRYASRAAALAEETGNRWFLAYCLIRLGNVAQSAGRTEEARRHYQTCYEIRRSFEDPGGMAVALVHLGEVSLVTGRPGEARQIYTESLNLYAQTGDRGGTATARCGLGRAAIALGDLAEAGRHLEESLRIAADMGFVTLTLSVLTAAGEWLALAGEPEMAVAALANVREHPACTERHRGRVERLLEGLRRRLPASDLDAAIQRGVSAEGQGMMEELLVRLAAPPATSTPSVTIAPPAQLPERLTAREQEILALVAEGLSNQQIAGRLFMTVGTIKWYCSQIYQKLQVSKRTQAVARARELGLLP